MQNLASNGSVGDFWEWLRNRETRPAEIHEPLQLELPMPPRLPRNEEGESSSSGTAVNEPERGVVIIDL